MNNETIREKINEHPRHILNFTGVPFANVLVERLVECKHV
jgi:protein-disulfide isomerase-like protein with CxxC motif